LLNNNDFIPDLDFGAVNETLWNNDVELEGDEGLHKGIKAKEAEFPWATLIGKRLRSGNKNYSEVLVYFSSIRRILSIKIKHFNSI